MSATAAESAGAPLPELVEPERRTGFLELFFDLVVVYAITQVTTFVLAEPTATGFARAGLALAIVWWAWGAWAWLTNSVDLEDTGIRLLFLGAMAGAFVMAFGLPQAFGADGLWFACGVVVVRVLWVPVFLLGLPGEDARQRHAVMTLTPYFLVSPLLILLGGFADDGWRTGLWVVALAIDVVGALSSANKGWRVSPSHFAERYELFVIIALGESVVAIGVGAADTPRDAGLLAAMLVALAGAAALWWAYFDWVARAAERGLARAADAVRAPLARDVYTFFHFPLVAGIILYAVACKKTVAHPGDPLSGAGRVALALGLGLCFLGFFLVRYRFVHAVAWERVGAAVATAVLVLVGGSLPATALLGLAVAILAVALALETRRLAAVRRRFRASG